MIAESDKTHQTICRSPITGEEIGRSTLHTASVVKEAISRARQAQKIWAYMDVKERAKHIKPLSRYLTVHADELAAIISRDNGKTRTDAMVGEVLPAAIAVAYYCRKAKAFLKERRLWPGTLVMANKAGRIIRAPYGVVGIISPWNYPFTIPFSEVVMALLAGNAVILKIASETQMVGRALERCFESLSLPADLFTYINMPGAQAGQCFLEAGADKLFFTGSVPVGKRLMAIASKTLTPVVLELGGNDPMLVCADANQERAVAGALWAGFQNCGQSCAGVERIYVHRTIYDSFLHRLAQGVEQLRVGPDIDHNVDLGAMTTVRQKSNVERQVADAVAAGASIVAQTRMTGQAVGNFMPAMVLADVDHTMELMRQETFGPVIGVMPVDTMDEAVLLANDTQFGLTASVWTEDSKKGEQLARQIKAGVVMINDHLMSHGLPETPWGGFKQSGIGRTHGAIGMAEMTQAQCLIHDHMPGIRRNLWWHPHDRDVYLGIHGILNLLHGPTIRRRFHGLVRFARIVPRMFRST